MSERDGMAGVEGLSKHVKELEGSEAGRVKHIAWEMRGEWMKEVQVGRD